MSVVVAITGGFKYLVLSGGPATTTALSTWTIAGWLNPSGTGAAETIEINGSAGAFINFDARNNQCILECNDNAGHNVALNSVSTISAGWFHYAGSWDGTTLRLYVNGVQDATNTTAFNFTGNNWSDLQIGPFDGQAQDAIFYNAALAAGEIAQLYDDRRPVRRTNLVAHIPLLDVTGSDYSGNGNSFTNNSATAGTSAPAATWGTAHPHFFKSGTTVNIAAAGSTQSTGAVAVSAAAGIAASATLQTSAQAVSVASAATLTVQGSTQSTGATANTAAATLTATGSVQGTGAAAIPATATLAASGVSQSSASVAVTATQANVAPSGTVQTIGASSMPASAALAGTGSVQSVGAASMPASAALGGSATVQVVGATTLSAAASVAGTGSMQSTGATALVSASGFAAAGSIQITGAATLARLTLISETGSVTTSGAVAVTASTAPMACAGNMQVSGATTLSKTTQQVPGIPRIYALGHPTVVHMRTNR